MKETDYLNVNEVSDLEIRTSYMDFKTTSNDVKSIEMFEKNIIIDKDYYPELNLLKEFINKVIEISNTSEYIENLAVFKTKSGNYTKKEIRQLLSIIINCGNYIAVNGRIGPAQFVIIPNKYLEKIQMHIKDQYLTNMLVVPTHFINDIIILGRKNSLHNPGIQGFYNKETNKYNIEVIGNAKYQYHILKITSLQDERNKKLREIEKNKY